MSRSYTGGMFRDRLRENYINLPDSNESAKAEGGSKARLKKFSVGKAGKGHDVFIGDDFIGKVWELEGGKYQVQQRKNNKWQDKGKSFGSRMAAVDWLKSNR